MLFHFFAVLVLFHFHFPPKISHVQFTPISKTHAYWLTYEQLSNQKTPSVSSSGWNINRKLPHVMLNSDKELQSTVYLVFGRWVGFIIINHSKPCQLRHSLGKGNGTRHSFRGLWAAIFSWHLVSKIWF